MSIRFSAGIIQFQLIIIDDLSLFRVHQKHFPRTESFLHKNMGLIHVDGSHLRGQNHITVIRDIIAGRSQAVAVQHSSQHIPVAEHNGGRSVPWFHHSGVVVVKILHFLGHGLIILPWSRDHDHHGQGEIHTAHHHEFQGIVKHGGIRAFLINNRKNLVHLSPEEF